MSVINQVLKDLDRQGANASTPSGVIAVNQREAAAPRGIWLALGLAGIAGLAAAWWFDVLPGLDADTPPLAPVLAAPPPPVAVAPQLQLSQQLSDVGRNPREGEAGFVSAVGRKSAAPSATSPAPPAASGASALAPANIAFVPQPPRLDTRLPEARSRPAEQPTEARQSVVKENKPLTPQMQAEDAWRQAGRLLEQGRNHDAQDQLESVLRLDPAHAGARQSLAALVLEAGDTARAEAVLNEGLALHPNDAWYPRSLAQLQLQRGNYAQAVGILKAGLAKRADAANWGLYASTLNKLGKREDTVQAYREALRLNPAQGNWWIGLAVALEQGDERADAAAAYQRALQTRLSAELREFAQQKVRELGAR
jgi:MSHA biogenesis protein MshN